MVTVTPLPRRARTHIGPMGFDVEFPMNETLNVFNCVKSTRTSVPFDELG